MRPVAEILIDGRALATTFYDALVSVRVTDELGIESDVVEIVLDEAAGEWEVPAAGARIDVRMGLREIGLVRMGTFAKDAAGGSGPVAELTIGGTAIDLGSTIRQPQTRSWEDVTLREVAARLAGEAGLRPVVAGEIADTPYPFIAQRAESGLHLLTRLARPLDAAAKAADGRLVLARRGGDTDAAGVEMAPVDVSPADLVSWTWSEEERGKYATVTARWKVSATGREGEVTAGSGTPEKTLRKIYATEAEANRAATAELDGSRRGDLRIDCDGRWRPELFAGGQVELRGLRSNLDGGAQITSVTHTLSAGAALTTAFSCSKQVAA